MYSIDSSTWLQVVSAFGQRRCTAQTFAWGSPVMWMVRMSSNPTLDQTVRSSFLVPLSPPRRPDGDAPIIIPSLPFPLMMIHHFIDLFRPLSPFCHCSCQSAKTCTGLVVRWLRVESIFAIFIPLTPLLLSPLWKSRKSWVVGITLVLSLIQVS